MRRRYRGYRVLVGLDAAIEISRTTVKGYIDGVPCHPDGQMEYAIAPRMEEFLDVVLPLLDFDTDMVVLAGELDQFSEVERPWFVPSLVHRVARNGAILSTGYKTDIFLKSDDPDLVPMGAGGTELREDAAYLQAYAELELGAEMRLSFGIPMIEGLLWFPDDDRLPIVYSNVNGRDSPACSVEAVSRSTRPGGFVQQGDGTFDGEFRA